LTVTFPGRRLLAPETWTAGWPIGGATAPGGESISRTLESWQCAGATFGSLKIATG